MSPLTETRSTAPAEQLDILCDQILARLAFVAEAQTITQIADALNATAVEVHEATDRLVRSNHIRCGNIAVKQGDAPTFSAKGFWHPQALPVSVLGKVSEEPAAAPARTTPKYSPGLRADISEAAAMALCLRRDLELAGEADEVLSDLQRAAAGLSRLLLADIRRRGVLA